MKFIQLFLLTLTVTASPPFSLAQTTPLELLKSDFQKANGPIDIARLLGSGTNMKSYPMQCIFYGYPTTAKSEQLVIKKIAVGNDRYSSSKIFLGVFNPSASSKQILERIEDDYYLPFTGFDAISTPNQFEANFNRGAHHFFEDQFSSDYFRVIYRLRKMGETYFLSRNDTSSHRGATTEEECEYRDLEPFYCYFNL